jgi:trk system potassium uptake protein TrkH
MATGGFSTQNTSIAGYSPYTQYVIVLFMLFAGTNFTLHYLGMHGKIKEIWKNEEYRYYILFTFGFVILITIFILLASNISVEEAFRNTLFQVVSIVTTTGFITSDYLIWPGNLWIFIFLLMFIGGCAGSTGGGIKIARQILLLKNSALEFKRMIHSKAVIPVRFNGRVVSQDIIHMIMAFFLYYILIFFGGTFIMTVLGLDFETAIGATIATLGNIGPGLGGVGPVENYSLLPDTAKWLSSFLMLLGRLELFTVLILFSPSFWKK